MLSLRPPARPAALIAGLLALTAPVRTLAAPPLQLAITFDDLPVHSALPPGETRVEVANKIIAALKAAGAPQVYGFVNGIGEEREPDSRGVLAAWRAAGFPLGNHTWSHMGLGAANLPDWEADVIRNEPLLEQHMGQGDWRWLRYPFLAEGDTPQVRAAARTFLAGRGYRIAQVTMSFADYAFNEPYARCAAKGDAAAIARMEADYLAAADDEVEHARAMSQTLYGRDIPYVLLMHIGAFDARMASRLLELYHAKGFTFVTLPVAEADPAYVTAHDLKRSEPDSLEGELRARNLPNPPRKVNFAWVETACR